MGTAIVKVAQFRNLGFGDLYWKATVVADGSPPWPEDSGIGFDDYESEELQGPLNHGSIQNLRVWVRASPEMTKTQSPYTATLTINAYSDRNQQNLVETVTQQLSVIIYSGPVIVLTGDLSFNVVDGDEDPVDKTAYLTNGGDQWLDWITELTLGAELSGKISVIPTEGEDLENGDTLPLTIRLTPSGIPLGEHSGLLIARDQTEFADPDSLQITVTVETGYPVIDITGDTLTWTLEPGETGADKTISVGNTGDAGTQLNWEMEYTPDDLPADNIGFTPASGLADQGESDEVTVSVDAEGLPGGPNGSPLTYEGGLRVADTVFSEDDVTPQIIPVTLNVELPPALYVVESNVPGHPFGHPYVVGDAWVYVGEANGYPAWSYYGMGGGNKVITADVPAFGRLYTNGGESFPVANSVRRDGVLSAGDFGVGKYWGYTQIYTDIKTGEYVTFSATPP